MYQLEIREHYAKNASVIIITMETLSQNVGKPISGNREPSFCVQYAEAAKLLKA